MNTVVSRSIGLAIIFSAIGIICFLWYQCGVDGCKFLETQPQKSVQTFADCAASGVPVLETFPRQCVYDGTTFVESIPPFGNDEIHIISPVRGATVMSPVVITGEAVGGWYFEGQFPIRIIDSERKGIAFGVAHAKGDWMTSDFVPFEATIPFFPATAHGALLFQKNNPSGLPDNSSTISLSVFFTASPEITTIPSPSIAPILPPVTSPEAQITGTLQGTMTIAPACPGPVAVGGKLCAPSVKMFASRTISVYASDKKTLITTITPGPTGEFIAMLPPGNYWVTMLPQILGSISGVPTDVHIDAEKTTRLSIAVDTGIRTSEDTDTPASSDGF